MLDLPSLSSKTQRISVGLHVAALWPDGLFYPGVVQSVIMRANRRDNLYVVWFEDGCQKEFTEGELIARGTEDLKDIHLKFNQRVFIDHSGRELMGFVQKHRKQTQEVFIKLADSEETLVRRKLRDIRLLPNTIESLPSDDRGYNLNSLREITTESKKRMVNTTDGIKPPSAKTQRFTKEEEPAMSEVMAAMILTSLHTAQPMEYSTAPSSPLSTSPESCTSSPSPSSSSGHFSWDFHSRGTPSPGLSISDAESSASSTQLTIGYPPQGTPAESMPGALVFSSSVDEGVDLSGDYSPHRGWDQICPSPKKLKIHDSPSRTLYKCTWQNCTKTLCSVQGIERHIRTVHLGKKENDFSDHEEEFYYTEIEPTMEAFSNTFASMMTSSPPPFDRSIGGATSPCDSSSQAFFPSSHITQHCNMNYSAGHSPDNTAHQQSIPSYKMRLETEISQRLQMDGGRSRHHSGSPPRSRHHSGSPPCKAQLQMAGLACTTKIRAEGRKCRKVYGMGHRNLWCTQCKWKKACTRFV